MKKSSSKAKKSDGDRSLQEVLRNLLEDPDMLETVPSELQAELRGREEQLVEIRKTSLSRIHCDNGDHVKLMQPLAFRKPSQM